MADWFTFIPAGMTAFDVYLLTGLSCLTSMLTAALGIGGGTVLLAVMAQVIPVKAIIPVHGVVQLGSNTGRALIMLSNVNWFFIGYFFIGCVFGALLGGQIVVTLEADILRLILGTFILMTVWVKTLFPKYSLNKLGLTIGGAVTSVLTMFVGATGPMVIAMARQTNGSPLQIVATSSVGLVIQHSLKIISFGFLGFVFTPYVPMITAMIITGFLGTLLGKRILVKAAPANFKLVLDLLISALALRLIYVAVQGLIAQ